MMAFRIIERKGTLRFLLPTPYFRGKKLISKKCFSKMTELTGESFDIKVKSPGSYSCLLSGFSFTLPLLCVLL